MDDRELAYVALRNRQVHDLWHVVFGCPTTVAGELGLKALEFVQVSTQCAQELVCTNDAAAEHIRQLSWMLLMLPATCIGHQHDAQC